MRCVTLTAVRVTRILCRISHNARPDWPSRGNCCSASNPDGASPTRSTRAGARVLAGVRGSGAGAVPAASCRTRRTHTSHRAGGQVVGGMVVYHPMFTLTFRYSSSRVYVSGGFVVKSVIIWIISVQLCAMSSCESSGEIDTEPACFESCAATCHSSRI